MTATEYTQLQDDGCPNCGAHGYHRQDDESTTGWFHRTLIAVVASRMNSEPWDNTELEREVE